jgi:hypothetical protein
MPLMAIGVLMCSPLTSGEFLSHLRRRVNDFEHRNRTSDQPLKHDDNHV